MFKIESFSVEAVKDPFGILTGERYEFRLELDVEEDDELYLEEGVCLRVVYALAEENSRIVKYEFLNKKTNQYIAFDMEEDEAQMVEQFCKEQLQPGAETENSPQ